MARDRRNNSEEDSLLDEMKPGAKAADAPGTRRGRKVFTCPGCGTRTYGDMAYCTDCGYKLSRECPNCAAQWRYEYSYAFCPGCGARLQSCKQPAGEEPGRNEATVSAERGGGS